MVVFLNCYPVHTGKDFRFWVCDTYPFMILCFVPANCECEVHFSLSNDLKHFQGTGKAQPADVGLNQSIKHHLKQAQMNYLIETYQKQVANGLDPKQVKFSSSLPVLWDASVAGIVKAYDFMTGPDGCDMIKKVCQFNHDLDSITNYSTLYRHGDDVLHTSGIFQPNAWPAK